MVQRSLRISNHLSLITARLRIARRQDHGGINERASGTGFFWGSDGKVFLITNWHNVTGWDPINERPLCSFGFTPNVLIADFAATLSTERGPELKWESLEIALFDNDGRPCWREHPTHRRKVDVVAIPVPVRPEDLATSPLWHDELIPFDPNVGDEVFAIGYPFGISGGRTLPIWKRGSIASEPDFDLDDMPKLLVDTATREGMSGSPVIAMSLGSMTFRDRVVPLQNFGTAMTFLGVYSGRVGDASLGAQLGIVWKADAVWDVVARGVEGSTPHD